MSANQLPAIRLTPKSVSGKWISACEGRHVFVKGGNQGA